MYTRVCYVNMPIGKYFLSPLVVYMNVSLTRTGKSEARVEGKVEVRDNDQNRTPG